MVNYQLLEVLTLTLNLQHKNYSLPSQLLLSRTGLQNHLQPRLQPSLAQSLQSVVRWYHRTGQPHSVLLRFVIDVAILPPEETKKVVVFWVDMDLMKRYHT